MQPFQTSTLRNCPCWVIFYFLWGDPLFSDPGFLRDDSTNDAMVQRRRALALMALDYYGFMSKVVEEKTNLIRKLKKLANQSRWREAQLLKHVPPDALDQVWIDFNVNKLDPDFSFEDSVKQYGAGIGGDSTD